MRLCRKQLISRKTGEGKKLKKKNPPFLFKKASFLFRSVFRLLLRGKQLAPLIFDVFLPAAKPSCPKTVRVVVVVVVGSGRGGEQFGSPII